MNPVIVQFLHPGFEERNVKPLSPTCSINGVSYDHIKHWTCSPERHGRKFIVNPVDYFDGQKNIRDEHMRLWCEAEWCSYCRKIGKGYHALFPYYEHVVKVVPACQHDHAHKGFNTDPYVFGDAFKYCCCQQVSHYGNPTRLHDLPQESIILFGSYKKINGAGGFYLDTVFVVDEKIGEYSNGNDMCRRIGSMSPAIQKKLSPTYQERVLQRIGQASPGTECASDCLPEDDCLPAGVQAAAGGNCETLSDECLPTGGQTNGCQGTPSKGLFSLYTSKVFDSQKPNAPFSFVPVIPGCPSYARPLLAPFSYNGTQVISPKQQQGFKVTEVQQNQLGMVWNSLLQAIPPQYKYAWHIDE